MLFDPENKINKLCAAGMQSEGEGKPEQAVLLFLQAWDEATTDLEKSVAAHYLARHQPSPTDKLRWDETALSYAIKEGNESLLTLLPSLYLNIAKCHEDLGKRDEALKHYSLAQQHSHCLSDDGYSSMIKSGIANGIQRTTRD